MASIAYLLIFGKPLILYLGILTLLSFLITAYVGTRVLDPQNGLPFRYHLWMARLSIALALIHGALGLSLYL